MRRSRRDREWKLMVDFKNKGRRELYNLSSDPFEEVNLIESTSPFVQATKQRLYNSMIEIMNNRNDALLKE